MKRAKQIVRVFLSSLAAVAAWLATANPAVAQANPPATSGGGGGGGMDYILSYMVVILALILGMLVVARSSSRRERERPAGYVGKNIMEED